MAKKGKKKLSSETKEQQSAQPSTSQTTAAFPVETPTTAAPPTIPAVPVVTLEPKATTSATPAPVQETPTHSVRPFSAQVLTSSVPVQPTKEDSARGKRRKAQTQQGRGKSVSHWIEPRIGTAELPVIPPFYGRPSQQGIVQASGDKQIEGRDTGFLRQDADQVRLGYPTDVPVPSGDAEQGGSSGRQTSASWQQEQRKPQPGGEPQTRSNVELSYQKLPEEKMAFAGATMKDEDKQQSQVQIQAQMPKSGAGTETSMEEITKGTSMLTLASRKELRKGGTEGRKITVETNHLALKINPKINKALHYDITITPDKPKRMMRPVWEVYRKRYLSGYNPAFDDVKNVYSPVELPDAGLTGVVTIAEDEMSRPKEYNVVIKFANMVNLAALTDYMKAGGANSLPQEALQCIDIVLRNAPALHFVRVGRSYFTPPRDEIINLGQGLEMWYGFYQSAILGWKPFLNVDVAHKGFPREMPVISLMAELANCRDQDLLRITSFEDKIKDAVSKYLKGLKIRYEIPGYPAIRKSVRVNGCKDSPKCATFVLDSGEETNVYKYYKKAYQYTIKYPDVPCLWVGSTSKKVYYPAELCTILKGQVVNRKLNEMQTREMVRRAATSTMVRKEKILNSVQQAQFNIDPCVRSFGLSVGDHFEKVPARILTPPALEYHQKSIINPQRGQWRAGKFLQHNPLEHWTILNISRAKEDTLENFVHSLLAVGRQQGMIISKPERPFERILYNPYEKSGRNPIQDYFVKNKKMQLLIVIIPEGSAYSKVKSEAELKVGCLTQCIKERTMFKMNPATAGNLLLKINSKLNGKNHKLADICRPKCLETPCMIMGADVTHPSPDQKDIPSVAAVCASHDPSAFQYNFCWRLQPARQEIITDLQNIMVEQLKFFRNKTNHQPDWIIFFRDGVSEGQFEQVLLAEVQAIRRACTSLNPNYKPSITFLVVQKRHHTRFFPTNKNDSEDRNFNVPAGTCVDTEITHATAMEYYLVSHASIQGVARPTKYRILWDDRDMTENEIQQLTYYLCHMFTRCTRSVSYPAPTYYAHLAAFRARVYLERDQINLNNLAQEQLQHKIKDEIAKEKPMFFV